MLARGTQEGYESTIRIHLIPALGHINLKDLKPQLIQAYYGRACANLSNRSVQHMHRVLSQAMKWAVKQGYIGRNPCDLVDAPRIIEKTMRTLTPTEVEILMACANDDYYYLVIYTEVSSEMRQAEL